MKKRGFRKAKSIVSLDHHDLLVYACLLPYAELSKTMLFFFWKKGEQRFFLLQNFENQNFILKKMAFSDVKKL